MRKRNRYIGVWFTEEEVIALDNLRKHETRSAFIRKRALNDLSNSQIAYIIMEFISNKLTNATLNPDKQLWSKHKLEKLKEKLKKPLNMDYIGMSEEEKAKFQKFDAERAENYSEITKEISEVLAKFFVE